MTSPATEQPTHHYDITLATSSEDGGFYHAGMIGMPSDAASEAHAGTLVHVGSQPDKLGRVRKLFRLVE
jgi:hypothetical protein